MIVSNSVTEKNLVPFKTIVMFAGSETEIPNGWALCDGRTVNGYTTPNLMDKFIKASNIPNQTGGSSTNIITIDNLPTHSHSFTGVEHSHNIKKHNHGMLHSHTGPGHTHNINHTHNIDHVHSINHTHDHAIEVVNNGEHSHIALENVDDMIPLIYYSYSATLGGLEENNIYGLYDYNTYGHPNAKSNGKWSNKGQFTSNSGIHSHSLTGSINEFIGNSSNASNTTTTTISTTRTDSGGTGNTGNSPSNTDDYGPFDTEKSIAIGNIGSTGNNAPINNEPQFYTLCFIMRVG